MKPQTIELDKLSALEIKGLIADTYMAIDQHHISLQQLQQQLNVLKDTLNKKQAGEADKPADNIEPNIKNLP